MGGLYGCQDTACVPQVCQGGVSVMDGGGDVHDQQHHAEPYILEESEGE